MPDKDLNRKQLLNFIKRVNTLTFVLGKFKEEKKISGVDVFELWRDACHWEEHLKSGKEIK